MLRITRQSRPGNRRAVLLEGRLVGPWVAELDRVVGELESAGEIAIDLGGVTFADADGVALLRRLRAAGVQLEAASGFLAALIGAHDDRGDGDGDGDGKDRDVG